MELARNELSVTGMWSFNRNSLSLILLPFEINNITQPGESELLAIQCLTFVPRQKAVTVRGRSTEKKSSLPDGRRNRLTSIKGHGGKSEIRTTSPLNSELENNNLTAPTPSKKKKNNNRQTDNQPANKRKRI